MDTQLEQLAKTDRNPIQETEYRNLLTAAGIPFTVINGRAAVEGFGTGGNAASSGDFRYASGNIQAQAAAMKAIQPAVDSLTAGLPEVANRFDTARSQAEAERDPLIERYENLISDLKASTQGMVSEAEGVWAQEAAKRGLTGSSTFVQEERLRRTQPIQQAGDAGVRDIALDRENKIRDLDNLIANLTLEQVAAERDIRNTIAELQATASTGALDRALQKYQIDETNRQAALDRALKEKELALTEMVANNPSNEIIEANGRKYLLTYDSQGKIISQQDIGSASSGSGSGSGAVDISSIFGSNSPTKENILSGQYKVTAPASVDRTLLGDFKTPITSQSLYGISGGVGAGQSVPSIGPKSDYNVPGVGNVSPKVKGSLSGFQIKY